jgi:large subunit ribosomal protein L24
MSRVSLKKGDTVTVITGKDKSKQGKIVSVDRKSGTITVEGVNIRTRFERPRKQGQKGQKVQFPAPLDPSKAMLICPSCGNPTRVGFQIQENGKKLRSCKKCKATF